MTDYDDEGYWLDEYGHQIGVCNACGDEAEAEQARQDRRRADDQGIAGEAGGWGLCLARRTHRMNRLRSALRERSPILAST